MSVKLGLGAPTLKGRAPRPRHARVQQVPQLHEDEGAEEGALGIALLGAAVIEIRFERQQQRGQHGDEGSAHAQDLGRQGGASG